MKLTYHCPICNKQLVLVKELQIGSSKLNQYKCGHLFASDLLHIDKANLDFTSVDGSGKNARPYQEDGVQFILESDFNCIIGDQMRLGKTPQSLLALKNAYRERTPALILVRSANLWQWIREYKVWCDALPNGIYPILGTDAFIPPGFSAYICSMDTFGSAGKCNCGHRYHEVACKAKNCTCRVFASDGQSVLDKLKKIPFKLIIADEAHSFKNGDSNRSQALVDFVTYLNAGESNLALTFTCSRCQNKWIEIGKQKYDKRIGHQVISKSTRCPKCEQYCYIQQSHNEKDKVNLSPQAAVKIEKLLALGTDKSTTDSERQLALTKAIEIQEKECVPIEKPCGLVLLTGTAIKNRAEEYFIPLNLCAPEKFSSLERFRRQWLEQDSKGKWSRVKRYNLDAFRETIKPYVLRREKEDVYTDLPSINRTFTLIEPDKETLGKQYNQILDKLEAKLGAKINPTYWDLADDMMELRRICGMMKLMWTADYLEMSLLDSENQRFAVGIHHKSVRDVLYFKLGSGMNCLKLSGEDSAWQKDQVMRAFETSSQRVLIINMLAGGIGMDFHYCNNVLILERQWNFADENQFEFRFYNPDKSIKQDPTNIEYVIAKGTLDEWWYDMVAEKERIFGETISNHWSIEQDADSFKQLVERTVGGRL